MTKNLLRIWNLRVSLDLASSHRAIPRQLFDEIYHLIREALVNVARHAEVLEARVRLDMQDNRVQIVVQDNGRGFPFHGYFDHATLDADERGPRSLKERVRSLGGTH